MNYQQHLQSVLSYDPETGILTWKEQRGRVRAGDRAGFPYGVGYRGIRVFGEQFYEHRIIWMLVHGKWPEYDLDHINRVRTDNRLRNLRETTRSENKQNQDDAPYPTNKTSGYKGAYKNGRRWQARVGLNNRTICLGTYDTPEEAHAVYINYKRTIHPYYQEGN